MDQNSSPLDTVGAIRMLAAAFQPAADRPIEDEDVSDLVTYGTPLDADHILGHTPAPVTIPQVAHSHVSPPIPLSLRLNDTPPQSVTESRHLSSSSVIDANELGSLVSERAAWYSSEGQAIPVSTQISATPSTAPGAAARSKAPSTAPGAAARSKAPSAAPRAAARSKAPSAAPRAAARSRAPKMLDAKHSCVLVGPRKVQRLGKQFANAPSTLRKTYAQHACTADLTSTDKVITTALHLYALQSAKERLGGRDRPSTTFKRQYARAYCMLWILRNVSGNWERDQLSIALRFVPYLRDVMSTASVEPVRTAVNSLLSGQHDAVHRMPRYTLLDAVRYVSTVFGMVKRGSEYSEDIAANTLQLLLEITLPRGDTGASLLLTYGSFTEALSARSTLADGDVTSRLRSKKGRRLYPSTYPEWGSKFWPCPSMMGWASPQTRTNLLGEVNAAMGPVNSPVKLPWTTINNFVKRSLGGLAKTYRGRTTVTPPPDSVVAKLPTPQQLYEVLIAELHEVARQTRIE